MNKPLLFGLLVSGSLALIAGSKLTKTVLRKSDHAIDSIFTNRWSARAMSGESLSNEELMKLFEAARWAPSSYNAQPWRFIYAHRNTPQWQPLFDLLVPFNQEWVKNAGVLVVVVSKKNFDSGDYSPTHSFDTGAACQNLALQGSLQGLVVHGMSGFDFAKAKTALNVPDDYSVEAMFAIGRPGDVKKLPEYMQNMEKPSDRRPVSEFIFEGSF